MGIVAWYLPYLMDIDEELNKSEDFFRVFEASSGSIDNTTGEEFEMDQMEGKIEFKDVDFAYPKKPAIKILKNINCSIPAGSSVAFVGGSGSGKSTIIRLLMRLYDTNKGRVSIDNRDLKDYNLPWLHHNVTAIVSQEPEMFEGTVAYNIAYGCVDREPSMEEIKKAAELADAHVFIEDKEKFPEGYETLVGEKGVKLSGGQK